MKAIFEFDLENETDYDEYQRMNKSLDMYLALDDIMRELRNVEKYANEELERQSAATWREFVHEAMSNRDLSGMFL